MNWQLFLCMSMTLIIINCHDRVFRRFTKNEQALFFECVPAGIGAIVPIVQNKPARVGIIVGLMSYSWLMTHYWGRYHQCSQQTMYEHALAGAVVGCIIAAIRRYRANKDIPVTQEQ